MQISGENICTAGLVGSCETDERSTCDPNTTSNSQAHLSTALEVIV